MLPCDVGTETEAHTHTDSPAGEGSSVHVEAKDAITLRVKAVTLH